MSTRQTEVVLCPPAGAPFHWVPPLAPGPAEHPELRRDFRQDLVYVGRVLHHVVQRVAGPLTVYVTRDVRQPLPSTGRNVVAVVLADEFERTPAYAGAVRAVFKRYGVRPHLDVRPMESPPQLVALKLAQWGRKLAMGAPGRIALARSTGRWSLDGMPLHVFPVGYFGQEELPVKPIEQRRYDVLFYGSSLRADPAGLRRRTGTVKAVGRAAMLEQAERLRRARPDLRVELVVTDAFGATAESCEPYSHALMDAKLCLSPAGNSPETYRNYEAWRSGSVPVTEGLPPLWFHASSPFLRVRPDWADLEAVVANAFADPGELRRMHERSLAHWRTVCSEAAIGAWMAERIDERR